MSDPLKKTFDYLARSKNPRSLNILKSALDLEEPALELAVGAILKRNNTHTHVELLYRYKSLSEKSRLLIEQNCLRLKTAIESALIQGGPARREVVLSLILAKERFEHLQSLLKIMVEEGGSASSITPGFRQMINRLFDHCCPFSESRKTGKYLQNATKIQASLLTSLDAAWSGIEDRETLELIWEAIFTLGTTESAVVKKLLEQAKEDVRDAAWGILATSTQPGVMQLLCDFLDNSASPKRVFEIVQQRTNPEFIIHLLRWLPDPMNANLKKNLRQFTSLEWLSPSEEKFDLLPPGVQDSLARFVEALGLSSEEKVLIHEWMIRHGGLEARLAATDALASGGQETVQEMLYESLDSDDSEIQAWATGQLRDRGVPEAVTLLVDRLDSPIEEVREAAREELHSFDLYQMLEMFEDVSDDVCHQAGELIQKIDPLTIRKLNVELRNPIQGRRIRAARGAFAMGLHLQVLPALISLLQDEDDMVRRVIAEILGHVANPEVVSSLEAIISDPNPRVREIAEQSLTRIQRNKTH
jgi:HEAT repeat protein